MLPKLGTLTAGQSGLPWDQDWIKWQRADNACVLQEGWLSRPHLYMPQEREKGWTQVLPHHERKFSPSKCMHRNGDRHYKLKEFCRVTYTRHMKITIKTFYVCGMNKWLRIIAFNIIVLNRFYPTWNNIFLSTLHFCIFGEGQLGGY